MDHFSKYIWYLPLCAKSNIVSVFLTFLKYVHNTFFTRVHAIQTDWGGEFRPLSKILQNFDISHRITCPSSHAQNGSIEWHHHHIVETGISLIGQSFVPTKYWSNAFQNVVFLINCMPTPILQNSSPFQTLLNSPFDYFFFCIFGSACWTNLRPFNRHKIDIRSKLYVLLGYTPDHKGYSCLHIPSKKIHVSHDVIF